MKFVYVKDVKYLTTTASPPLDNFGTNVSHSEIGGIDIEFPVCNPTMHFPGP